MTSEAWHSRSADGALARFRSQRLDSRPRTMMIMGQFLSTFKEFPPSQVSGSLSVEKALEALQKGGRKN